MERLCRWRNEERTPPNPGGTREEKKEGRRRWEDERRDFWERAGLVFCFFYFACVNCVALSLQRGSVSAAGVSLLLLLFLFSFFLFCFYFILFFWMCYRSRANWFVLTRAHTTHTCIYTHTHPRTHMHTCTPTPERLSSCPQIICIVKKVPVFVICMYKSEYQKYERNKDVELFPYVMQTEWL